MLGLVLVDHAQLARVRDDHVVADFGQQVVHPARLPARLDGDPGRLATLEALA